MQNLRNLLMIRLAYLTMAIICTNYVSILAQDEQKAFKEGDKILSVGIGGGNMQDIGYGQATGIKGAIGIAYEEAIKGTNGILSIGGFGNFKTSSQNFLADKAIFPYYDTYTKKVDEISGGIKFGIHYATRKLDLYGGLKIGGSYAYLHDDSYGIRPNVIIGYENSLDKLNLLINPYIGARYYFTNKLGLQFEIDNRKHTTIGVVFKF